MNISTIDDFGDPRLDLYRNLKDKVLLREGYLIAEGKILVERLLESGLSVHSVLKSDRYKTLPFDVPVEVDVYSVSDSLVEQITGFKFHRGILAAAERPLVHDLEALEEDLSKRDCFNMIVSTNSGNNENLGALIRSARALGVDFLVLGEKNCDPFSRKGLKAGMGAQFRYPIYKTDNLFKDFSIIKRKYNIKCYFAVAEDGQNLENLSFGSRNAVFLGNEATGIPDYLDGLCDIDFTIPMYDGADSLNLAVSSGIIMYKMKNKRN